MKNEKEFYDVVNYYIQDGSIKREKHENLDRWSDVLSHAYCLDGEVDNRPLHLGDEDSYTVVYTWLSWVVKSTDPWVTPDDVECKLIHEKIYTQPLKNQNKWN